MTTCTTCEADFDTALCPICGADPSKGVRIGNESIDITDIVIKLRTEDITEATQTILTFLVQFSSLVRAGKGMAQKLEQLDAGFATVNQHAEYRELIAAWGDAVGALTS